MEHIDRVAFRIELDGNGSLRWKINRAGQEIIYEDEPYVGFWSKLSVWFIGLLPVESFL